MGSLLSVKGNTDEKEIIEDDQFHDALEETEIPDKMLAFSKNQEHLVTDAVESTNTPIYMTTSHITYERVAEIEKELAYYEKVSLVFLLYDQEDKALQTLLVEKENNKRGSSTNLLSDWANSYHVSSSSWQDRLVEALCVIQNFALIRKLGLNKEEMNSRFLPSQSCTVLHLDGVMKALYLLCEQLCPEDTKIFLNHLANDFRNKNLVFQDFGEIYLEMYLLQCFSVKYISKSDLSNLIKILKNMGMTGKADILELVVGRSQSTEHVENLKTRNFDLNKPVENYAPSPQPNCSKYSVISDNSNVQTADEEECYKIDPNNVGICLIINEKKFYREKKKYIPIKDDASWEEFQDFEDIPETDLEERFGSEVDEAALSRTFTKLGFKIICRSNLTHTQMIPTIKEIMNSFTEKDSCFVVCILSHGIKGKIYAANSVTVGIEKIKDTLHDRTYQTLLGKPKVLIIQSCQGKTKQKVYRSTDPDDIQTDGPCQTECNSIMDKSGVPQKCDLLVGLSTVTGFVSFRSKTTGSWYIQQLCKTIEDKCDEEHMLDILTSVHYEVTRKRWSQEEGIFAMVPEFHTNLRFKLYLRKIRDL